MAVEPIRVVDGVAPPWLVATRVITSAELLDLHTSGNDITLIPAPGEGKVIVPFEAIMTHIPAATAVAYTGSANVALQYGTTGISNFLIAASGLLSTTTKITRRVALRASTTTITENELLSVALSSDVAAGTGTLTITILYRIMDV